MNKLANSRAYLCGAMDRAPDAGVTWRVNIRKALDPLGITWLDPTRKPIALGLEDDASRQRRRDAKKAGDWGIVQEEMKMIRAVDLRMVDIADFLIVNLDLDIHATGTYEEIFLANQQRKPIMIHIEQGKQNTPDWLFGAIPHDYFFSDWDALVERLRDIATGDYSPDKKRWFFFSWHTEHSTLLSKLTSGPGPTAGIEQLYRSVYERKVRP